MKRYGVKGNISVTPGKENECDSVSSGERKRNRLNLGNLFPRGCGTLMWDTESEYNVLESSTKDRDSRVCEAQSALEVSQVMRCT